MINTHFNFPLEFVIKKSTDCELLSEGHVSNKKNGLIFRFGNKSDI